MKWLLSGFLLCLPLYGAESKPNWFLQMETGPVWQSRNDCRIPGDSGTLFSIKDFGSGPFLAGRVYAGYRWTEKSEFRLLFAPLSLKGSRVLDSNVSFQGQTFSSGVTTDSLFRFNSYRLTYRYRVVDDENLNVWVGFTAKVRDAEIALTQGTTTASKSDLGFVPLLHFRANLQLSPVMSLDIDGDALAAPQGRAEDIVVRLIYDLNPTWHANLGYRLLEGGADNSKVYTFSFLHYAVAGLQIDF
ncbi:MAG: hypothetical protein EBQ92_07995 [Proteobacteria bacterium]|nr:hypothetical protein [Pseudomonadota bacterium]